MTIVVDEEVPLEVVPVASARVLAGGSMTTVQDVPGRVGYWHVGVPPNGPMDDLSHRLVNAVLGNEEGAAALELTGSGPELIFDAEVVVAVGGAAMPLTVDGRSAPPWTPIVVAPGAVVRVGTVEGPGLRATLGVRGGIAVPRYLGSRSTFTLGQFGGFDGRALAADDILPVGSGVEAMPRPLPPGMAPAIGHRWEIGVLVGPHTAPEFLTTAGLDELLRTEWEVHFNSARTPGCASSVRRSAGPAPTVARPGCTRRTSTTRATPSVPSTSPVTCRSSSVPMVPVSVGSSVPPSSPPPSGGSWVSSHRVTGFVWSRSRRARPPSASNVGSWLARSVEPVEPVARPVWNHAPTPSTPRGEAILHRVEATDNAPAVTFRQAGDRFLLVEMGDMTLDLELRLRVHVLDRWVRDELTSGVVDATAGVRSLLVQVDGTDLTVEGALSALRGAVDELDDAVAEPCPSRVVHLPLSWDDPATREAIERYMHGVRADAPWCPWNIEFIRRINGLDSVDDVHRTVFDASYLVLGLGDVYLGAPVATPLDPRHRLVTTKYNPARTWTAENSVGIGGAYLCIYGMEGPGGYQFVGRTVQVWNRERLGPHFTEPWLLRTFDQIRWYPVSADELLDLRAEQGRGALELQIEDETFRIENHRRFLADHEAAIAAFRRTQQGAFDVERRAWADAGELLE